MWTTLAFAAVLSLTAGQTDSLSLSNAHITYGVRGATRPDSKFLPGDQFVLTFDIDGITVDDSGKVRYSMATEVSSKGKVLFAQQPREQDTTVALGGKHLPGFAQIEIGLDQEPGEYTVKVTVTDLPTKRSGSITQTVQLLPKGFGIVRLATTNDPEGRTSTTLFGTGEAVLVSYNVVGFERDKSSGQPRVSAELRIVDDMGKPTVAKPFTGEISKDVPANATSVPVQFLLNLNRPGKFTVTIKAVDQISKKSAELSFPLVVQPSK